MVHTNGLYTWQVSENIYLVTGSWGEQWPQAQGLDSGYTAPVATLGPHLIWIMSIITDLHHRVKESLWGNEWDHPCQEFRTTVTSTCSINVRCHYCCSQYPRGVCVHLKSLTTKKGWKLKQNNLRFLSSDWSHRLSPARAEEKLKDLTSNFWFIWFKTNTSRPCPVMFFTKGGL